MRPEFTASQIERFWQKVDRSGGPDACWLWLGRLDEGGYGRADIRLTDGQVVPRAHRVAWIIEHGPIPRGARLCHRCDVRRCCNVAHLFPGTDRDNMLDAIAKGRRPGLPASSVAEMRRLAGGGWKMRDIARRFGVSLSAVNHLLNGRTWTFIADGAEEASGRKRRKLTREDAVRIRELSATMRQKEIARLFGVSQCLVSQIVAGKKWK